MLQNEGGNYYNYIVNRCLFKIIDIATKIFSLTDFLIQIYMYVMTTKSHVDAMPACAQVGK